jgi:hypothetical protein
MKCILEIRKCLMQKLTGRMKSDSTEGYDEFVGYEAFCEQCLPRDLSPQYRNILLAEKTLPWVIKG